MKKMKMGLFIVLSLVLGNASVAFGAAEEEKNELMTEATQAETIQAMKEFKAAAATLRSDNGLTDEDLAAMKVEVIAYYNDQFGEEYKKKNGGKANPKLAAHIGGLHPDQIAAQAYYIARNPHPLGSKHLLMKASDNSKYSALHEKYHPKFSNILEDLGLYDIFLLDSKTGNIVYSVYKELDYFGDHIDGPNAPSGLGEAFQKALKAPKGTVVESRVDKYNFSYDALALFIATKISDDGVLVYQVNP